MRSTWIRNKIKRGTRTDGAEETEQTEEKGGVYAAGIFDGDMVIVEQQPTADNGDIVVAMIEDSATVKRFYKEDGYYRLQPENDTMDPIIVSEVSIIGKVVGLYRSMK